MSGLKVEGIEEIRRKLQFIEQLEPLRAELEALGIYVADAASVVPPVSRRPQGFVNDRQRIGFFKRLRAGDIEVPYRRGISPGSQDLPHSWAYQVRGLSLFVTNRTGYGPLVQSAAKQTRYHKMTGWNTIEKIRDDATPVILERLTEAIDRQLGG